MSEFTRPSQDAIDKARKAIEAELGSEKLIADPDLMERYGEDWSHAAPTMPDMVVRAETAEDVQAVFRHATAHRVPVTPRGLGTGKSGGAIPLFGGIVLSLERMNRMLDVDPRNMVARAEPGIITGDFMRAVEAEDLFYPPDPNSLEICSLGGNVACNAGGPRALKYGVTRAYILAVEIVLPTGERLRCGRPTIKCVTGYDLVGMMVGSEGTLGVITEIQARLVPLPPAVQTSLVSFRSLETAAEAITKILGTGVTPRTLEFLDIHALEAVREKTPGVFPDDAEALLILETDGADEDRALEDLSKAAEVCLEVGALDVLVAQDASQRERMWAPRRILSQTLTETSQHKLSEDIVVPRALIPEMLSRCQKASDEHQIRIATYGHAGDGNIHVNILYDDASKTRADRAVVDIMRLAVELNGTISGEHGIGVTKRDFIAFEQSDAQIALQKRLKAQFDPAQILNPGKIFGRSLGR